MVKKHIAFIAHEKKMDELVELASEFSDFLRQCVLLATGSTGKRLSEDVGLNVERKLSGSFGGDMQIGAEVVEGKVDCLIFLVRACDVHNVVCATNLATARVLLSYFQSPRHNHN